MKKLSIIVPCFNESKRLNMTIQKIKNWHPTEFIPFFIFVNDGSTDNTYQWLETNLPQIQYDYKIIDAEENLGKGGAISLGVFQNQNELFCHWDADASIDIECIETAYSKIIESRSDIAVANRYHTNSIQRKPDLVRLVISHGFRIYRNMLLPSNFVEDSQCGLKIYNTAQTTHLFRELQETRFLFDLEILLKAKKQNLQIVEFPITWEHVDGGTVNFRSAFLNAFLAPIKMRFKTIN